MEPKRSSQMLWIVLGGASFAALWLLFLRPATAGLNGVGAALCGCSKRRKRR
jgi:hypothetical protein